jgi:hypothetical protein
MLSQSYRAQRRQGPDGTLDRSAPEMAGRSPGWLKSRWGELPAIQADVATPRTSTLELSFRRRHR